jgi:hypothetical protein
VVELIITLLHQPLDLFKVAVHRIITQLVLVADTEQLALILIMLVVLMLDQQRVLELVAVKELILTVGQLLGLVVRLVLQECMELYHDNYKRIY